jgi:hypothetical protein
MSSEASQGNRYRLDASTLPCSWQGSGPHLVDVDVQGGPGSSSLHCLQFQLLQMSGSFAEQGRCSRVQLYKVARTDTKERLEGQRDIRDEGLLPEPDSQHPSACHHLLQLDAV